MQLDAGERDLAGIERTGKYIKSDVHNNDKTKFHIPILRTLPKNTSKDFYFKISFTFESNDIAQIIHCFNFLNSKALKQITKTLVAIGGALLITGGAVVNFLQARKPPLTPQEELTLANIEALAIPPELGEDGKCPNGFRRFTIVELPGGGSVSGGGYDCFCVWREGVGSGKCK